MCDVSVKAYQEQVQKLGYTIGRLESVIDRWDVPKYTEQSQPMRGLLAELRQVLHEEQN